MHRVHDPKVSDRKMSWSFVKSIYAIGLVESGMKLGYSSHLKHTPVDPGKGSTFRSLI